MFCDLGGPDFDSMTYHEFFKYYSFGKRKSGQNYLDERGKYVCRRAEGKEAMIRTREIKVTKSEDAFMHLLMLNYPWRTDVDSWIGIGKDHGTYQSLALQVLGRERIEQLADGLVAVLDYGNVYENVEDEGVVELPRDFRWTDDQRNVLDMVKSRLESRKKCLMLVTGAAGTGKSTVLEEIHRIAKNEGFEPIRLAPSGVAAVNIKGLTIHRWFRFTKFGRQFPEANSYAIREQLMDIADRGLRPLFLIDEVSMIPGTLLNVISKSLQEAGSADFGTPFGGFPVILFGDFGQLGPVSQTVSITDWVWKSPLYRSFERVDLTEQCRQSGDVGFKSMLDDIRRGRVTRSMLSVFLEIVNRSESVPKDAIHLYPFKKEVEEFNLKKLQNLAGKDWYSVASDNAGVTKDEEKRKAIEVETGLLTVLWLKVGARVMCTSNVDVPGRIVNGTTGTVVRFFGLHVVQVKEDKTGRVFNIQKECRQTKFNGKERRQFPLVPAWAMTIHKCQSLTLNKAVVSLCDVFASGQAYVAMSRVRSRHDLFIENWSARGLMSVKHAIKSRLTKVAEESRTEADEELENLEESLDFQSDDDDDHVADDYVAELSWRRGMKEMCLPGWKDYIKSGQADGNEEQDISDEFDHEIQSCRSERRSSMSLEPIEQAMDALEMSDFEGLSESESVTLERAAIIKDVRSGKEVGHPRNTRKTREMVNVRSRKKRHSEIVSVGSSFSIGKRRMPVASRERTRNESPDATESDNENDVDDDGCVPVSNKRKASFDEVDTGRFKSLKI